jgi:hypothetical protein
VERVLRDHYPRPLSASQIAEVLELEGYRWPLPAGYFHSRGKTVYRVEQDGDPTSQRVRRICEMKGNRTRISQEGLRGRTRLYSIYRWALSDDESEIRPAEQK